MDQTNLSWKCILSYCVSITSNIHDNKLEEILRDKTMDDKLMYIPNDDKQNQCNLQSNDHM